ncbi:MAG: hypothetical protein AAF654_06405 [Myxococcota bacterium]
MMPPDAGNSSTDVDSGVLSLSVPVAGGATNASRVPFSVECEFSGQSVTLTLSCGMAVELACGPTGVDGEINTTSCPDGPVQLTATSAGASDSVSFDIDRIAPNPPLLKFPFRAGQPAGHSTWVHGSCDPDGEILVFVNDGSSTGTTTLPCDINGSFSGFTDLTQFPLGGLDVTVVGVDLAGNLSAGVSEQIVRTSEACDTPAARARIGGFAGGSGTRNDPYVLCTPSQLAQVQGAQNESFIFGSDIYLQSADSNGDGVVDGFDTDFTTAPGWTPVDSIGTSLDGAGFAITGLTIERANESDVALFSSIDFVSRVLLFEPSVVGEERVGTLAVSLYLARDTEVVRGNVRGKTNVGGLVAEVRPDGILSSSRVDANITGQVRVGGIVGNLQAYAVAYGLAFSGSVRGNSQVGGIAGLSDDWIYNSYANGVITGTADDVGGIVGQAGHLRNTLFVGDVSGRDRVGCLVGFKNQGSIYDSIASCSTVVGEGSNVGPVVGFDNLGEFDRNFYANALECVSNFGANCNSTGASRDLNLSNPSELAFANWSIRVDSDSSDSTIWVARPSAPPLLFFETQSNYTSTLSGSGTPTDPYRIDSAENFVEVSSKPAYQWAHFELAQSIDVSGLVSFQGLFHELPFHGVFDGGDFEIQGFRISETSESRGSVGFIGVLAGGDLDRLALQTPDIRTLDRCGAVLGNGVSDEVLTRLSSSGGTVNCASLSGGLIGSLSGTIERSSSDTHVTCSNWFCGGLVGAGNLTVLDSYATGDVSGIGEIGGLVGVTTSGSIRRSYASGNVTGSARDIGGLVGRTFGAVHDSFATGAVLGDDGSVRVGALVGSSDTLSAQSNGLFFLGSAGCNNNGAGSCNGVGVPVTPLSYFQVSGNSPLSGWDSATVWQIGTDLPTLR